MSSLNRLEFRKILKELAKLDWTTGDKSPVFYSGIWTGFILDKLNQDLDDGRPREFMLIDETEGGKWTTAIVRNERGVISDAQKEDIFREASRHFAIAAKGPVFALVREPRHDSLFFENELPNLIQNERVTTINGFQKCELRLPEKQLSKMFEYSTNQIMKHALFRAKEKQVEHTLEKNMREIRQAMEEFKITNEGIESRIERTGADVDFDKNLKQQKLKEIERERQF